MARTAVTDDMAERIRKASAWDIIWTALDTYGVHWLSWPFPDVSGPTRRWADHCIDLMAQHSKIDVDEIRRRVLSIDNEPTRRLLS
jgi:hypothetical protein